MDLDRIAVFVRMRGDLARQFQDFLFQSGVDPARGRAEAARQLIERGLFLIDQPAGHVGEIALQIAIRRWELALHQELARLHFGEDQRAMRAALESAAAHLGVPR